MPFWLVIFTSGLYVTLSRETQTTNSDAPAAVLVT
jgi:hypothetical protein